MAPLRKATKLGEAMVWHHFISATGEQGEAWFRLYLDAGGDDFGGRLDVGVLKIRRGQEAEGERILNECASTLDALESADPSIPLVLRLSYLSACAYRHYHHGELDSAQAVLDECDSVVAETLAVAPFLVPIAGRCCDFRLHRVRLARDQRRWQDMWRHLDRGRRMVSGEIPLCRAAGQDFFMPEVCAFYRALEPADEIEREALDLLSQLQQRLQTFANRALAATLIPNMVVNYP